MKDPAPSWDEQIALMAANGRRLAEFIETMRPQYATYAKGYKAFFDALRAEGFTDVQALEIVKARGLTPG